MARDLSARLLAQVSAAALRPVLFYEGHFSTGVLRLWSGVGTKRWNGLDWTGAGHLLSVSEIEETAEIRAAGTTVSLSGMDPSIISAALAAARQGLPGTVWIGALVREAWASLPGASGNYLSTLHQAGFAFASGTIEVVARIAAADYTPAVFPRIVCQDTATAATSSWRLLMSTSGTLSLDVSDGSNYLGVASTVSLASLLADGDAIWVKASVDFDDGAGNRVGRFATSSDGLTWTALGATVTTAGTVAMNATSLVCSIGATNSGNVGLFTGQIHYVEVRDGIDGPVVARFDPASDARLRDKSFTSTTGEVWTVHQSGSPEATIAVDDGAVVADPFLAFEGRTDVPDIAKDGERCTVSIHYESRLIALERPRERRITHEDQQIDYPGDRGREYIAGLQDKVLVW